MDYGMMIGVNSAVPDRTYLYNSGDECTDVTGGWGFYAYAKQLYLASNTSISKGSESMTITSKGTSSSGGYGVLYTTNKIDLTNVTTFHLDGFVTPATIGTYSAMMILTDKPSDSLTNGVDGILKKSKNIYTITSRQDITLDVSDISGEYYVGFYCAQTDLRASYTGKLTIHNIWLDLDTTHMADVAREVEQIYTEADLVAREVTEGWVEVNNVARKFFGASGLLYNYGDECVDVTGGWNLKWTNPGSFWSSNCYLGTKNADHLSISSKSSKRMETFITTNK
ncbi:MAG: hypothetical protein IIV02_06900, partial [Peptococcaceae bacterium]|nr:hypothetical protein [Peptococcaceae bacterium]